MAHSRQSSNWYAFGTPKPARDAILDNPEAQFFQSLSSISRMATPKSSMEGNIKSAHSTTLSTMRGSMVVVMIFAILTLIPPVSRFDVDNDLPHLIISTHRVGRKAEAQFAALLLEEHLLLVLL